jgi:hypothetical protein
MVVNQIMSDYNIPLMFHFWADKRSAAIQVGVCSFES